MYRQNVIQKNNIFPLQSLHKLLGFPIFLHLADEGYSRDMPCTLSMIFMFLI